ncbi:hypothetical protein WN943_015938 [Citrus x changshan-huyou]
MSRFKVPSEAEILTDYDLVLEQYLPPSSPLLAGFCVDAFSAIKPGVAHSPSSDSDIWDKSARAGTPMYFDFPRPMQSCRVSFKLLGDVTALAVEPSEQDDSGLRAPLVAAGLSLSNRIKLYYYFSCLIVIYTRIKEFWV